MKQSKLSTTDSAQRTANQYTKRKYLTQKFILGLIDLQSTLTAQYWKTYHCSSELTKADSYSSDGTLINSRILTKHCKSRWCIVCSLKRTTELVHKYKSILDSWVDSQFLTLTVPSVQADNLPKALDTMRSQLAKANRNINQKRKALGLEPIKFIAHFETTYNPEFNDYHPHIHSVVFNNEDAQELRLEWLKRFPACNPMFQDIRKADEGSTRELFKYFTKVISTDKAIYLQALNTIFEAIKGRQTFTAFGIKADTSSKKDYSEFIAQIEKETTDTILSNFKYIHDFKTYVNTDTGEVLSNYEVSESLEQIKVQKYNPKPKYNNPARASHVLLTRQQLKKDRLLTSPGKTRQKRFMELTE